MSACTCPKWPARQTEFCPEHGISCPYDPAVTGAKHSPKKLAPKGAQRPPREPATPRFVRPVFQTDYLAVNEYEDQKGKFLTFTTLGTDSMTRGTVKQLGQRLIRWAEEEV